MAEAARVATFGIRDGRPIGFAEVVSVPLVGARVVPFARMRAAVVRDRTLDDPIRQRLTLCGVEEIAVIRLLEDRKDRRARVGRQGGGLAFRIGNTPNRLKIVFDAVARLGRRAAVALYTSRVEDRAHVLVDQRRRLTLTLFGAPKEQQSAESQPGAAEPGSQSAHGTGVLGSRSRWHSPHSFVNAMGCSGWPPSQRVIVKRWLAMSFQKY